MSKSHKPTDRLERRIEDSINEKIRIDLLRILSERSATPRQLAKILEEDPSDVLDHLAELWVDGCVEVLADEGADADAVDRRYRMAAPFFLDDKEVEDLSAPEREASATFVLQAILSEAMGALRAGSFGSRADSHLSMKSMRLDDRGWREFIALLLRTLKETEAIEESSRERLTIAGDAGFEAVVALMGFERSESRAG